MLNSSARENMRRSVVRPAKGGVLMGVAPDVQARLNTAIRQAAADPAFVADQQAQGVVMVRGSRLTPEGHKAYIEETIPLWQLIVSVSKAGAR